MIKLQSALFESLAREDDPKQGLFDALQAAIRLEFATIPLYLYAQYSLDAARNQDIYDLLGSIVIEEMLHMTLACNILTAIGGRPSIASAADSPVYPGPLPGGVHDNLTVHLAPFSMSQLACFLTIEEPDTPIDFPLTTFVEAIHREETIGDFYKGIARRLEQLTGDGTVQFSGTTTSQVTTAPLDNLIAVVDLATARQAIEIIIEQGEGTAQSPLEAASSEEFAHFYRLKSIEKGRILIPDPDATPDTPVRDRYKYGGAAIHFDEAGVFPVPTDPKSSNFAVGTAERIAIDECNNTYRQLLSGLQTAFSGSPGTMQQAIILMRTLRDQAIALAEGKRVPGAHLGVPFESV